MLAHSRTDSDAQEIPVLAISGADICRLDAGTLDELGAAAALDRLMQAPHLVCHFVFTGATLARLSGAAVHDVLKAAEQAHPDIMELYAFVRPARTCRPTADGIAEALGLERPSGADDAALILAQSAMLLLDELGKAAKTDRRLAQMTLNLARSGWAWGGHAIAALSAHSLPVDQIAPGHGLDVWNAIKPHEMGPGFRSRNGSGAVSGEEARNALSVLLGPESEIRDGQSDYAAEVSAAFNPREEEGQPQIVLAEAGTGIGKTLGYIAPAAAWARGAEDTVWLSTYTRNLQRQIDSELDRLYPETDKKTTKAVIRKGRENYLCLLNFEELASAPRGRNAVLAALIGRWALNSRDGDMIGGDFPAWLPALFLGGRAFNGAGGSGTASLLGLTDRRGECIYAACSHFNRCFIERAAARARRAEMVIANHAFIMSRKAAESLEPPGTDPSRREISQRIVFDEGHHVFEAADSAFSAHLTALEMSELRRWLRGAEARRRRGRGLQDRIGDLIADEEELVANLTEALEASRTLPGHGWPQRLDEGAPRGAAEHFLALARTQVRARSDASHGFSLETEVHPLISGLDDAARQLRTGLLQIIAPLKQVSAAMRKILADKADELDSADRSRLEGAAGGIERRVLGSLTAWADMLEALDGETPPDFADWFALERHQGRDMDIGLHRHWIDPAKPFADVVLSGVDGAVLTSATLRDRPPEVPEDWASAQMRTGAQHLTLPPRHFAAASPFDYGAQTRIFVITDVTKTDPDLVASAMRALFIAAGGGALGLFTAIHRLRAVHERLAGPLLHSGIPLYAQHIDPLDTGSLVDIFRAEHKACLLGTDALRDGVDVPGASLRLTVFDRVPWPRSNIIERRRRSAFGGNAWTDMTTRLKLSQAFGRLIRKQDDRGVFVLLDRQTPTRLLSAFPPEAPVERIGLAEAVGNIKDFLSG